jgi:diadenosine tetraphosphatase ApaH/serine/threonine PP2A family protein phosphatase
MKAILSDIHGNLEALQAVLDDSARHDVEAAYCLGDVFGHGGPDPRECVDLAMGGRLDGQPRSSRVPKHGRLRGNGPGGTAVGGGTDTGPHPQPGSSRTAVPVLAGLPWTNHDGDCLFVHGSPRNPLFEYVSPEDIHNEQKMGRIFTLVDRCCFAGHTHVPGLFTEDGRFTRPEEARHVHRLDGRKTLVNVGSVGLPRDGDWRACCVLLEGETIRFRKVEYDVEATVHKIYLIEALADFLGDRLRDGR